MLYFSHCSIYLEETHMYWAWTPPQTLAHMHAAQILTKGVTTLLIPAGELYPPCLQSPLPHMPPFCSGYLPMSYPQNSLPWFSNLNINRNSWGSCQECSQALRAGSGHLGRTQESAHEEQAPRATSCRLGPRVHSPSASQALWGRNYVHPHVCVL